MASKKMNKKRGRDAEFSIVSKSKRKTAKKMFKEFAFGYEDEKEKKIPMQRESFHGADLDKKTEREDCSNYSLMCLMAISAFAYSCINWAKAVNYMKRLLTLQAAEI